MNGPALPPAIDGARAAARGIPPLVAFLMPSSLADNAAKNLIVNRQNSVTLNLPALRAHVARLRGILRMGRRKFTILFVDDSEIARLNSAYRGKRRPTDVLSFSWKSSGHSDNGFPTQEFKNHLGDIVISAETARRNARIEDHSTNTEICWLILHGVLHLLGWDHEADRGEMTALEHSLRAKLSG